MNKSYPIMPVAKPRMTQQDKWKKRPCVIKYRAFCDACRFHAVDVQSGDHVIFYLPMPKSWSLKKRGKMATKPHEIRPDIDNLLKALLDAVFGEDKHIYDIRVSKYWSMSGGSIEIKR